MSVLASVLGCTLWTPDARSEAPSSSLKAANLAANDECIIDSSMTLAEAIGNPHVPAKITRQLTLVTVRYMAMDGRIHQGQLVANRSVAGDLAAIFKEVERSKFPIARVIPVSKYHNSDALSMADNNSSCFNYRLVPGTRRHSQHATGKAIDINPVSNPYLYHGVFRPEGAKYNPHQPGTIVPSSVIYRAFIRRGWFWGGRWKKDRDYQHFQQAGKR